MASISEILVGQASKAIESTKADTDALSRGLQTGAQLAAQAENLRQQKAQLEAKKAEAQTAKWDKIGNYFETYSKMPEGGAKKAFGKNFIPNAINALGMTDQFNPTSLEMLQSDPTLATYLRYQVRDGKMTQEQLAQAARDPEYLAQLLPDAAQYGSFENYKNTFESAGPELNKADESLRDENAQNMRAAMSGRSQERSAAIAAGKEDWKREDALRNEVTSHPISKTSYVVNEAFDKIKGVVYKPDGTPSKPSAAGDMSLVFGYMKMLDPNSTVREGEQAQARDAAGVPERIINLYNNLRSGQTLNPKQRAEFVRQAEKIHSQQQNKQEKLNNQYTTIAKKAGVDPSVIVTGTEVQKGTPPQTTTFAIAGANMSPAQAKAYLTSNASDSPKVKAYKEAQRKKFGKDLGF